MHVAHVRLTKHYEHRKNENKIEFEEDSASDSGDFIREECLKSAHRVEEVMCRCLGHRMFLSHRRVGSRGVHGHWSVSSVRYVEMLGRQERRLILPLYTCYPPCTYTIYRSVGSRG